MQPSRHSERPATRLKHSPRQAHQAAMPVPVPVLVPSPFPERPYRLAQSHPRHGRSIVRVGDALIGGPVPVVIGGPCSV
jgi:hypothetical protein